MERKYTVTIRMVDTKEQIIVESQPDRFSDISTLSDEVSPSEQSNVTPWSQDADAVHTNDQDIATVRRVPLSRKQKLDYLSFFILCLAGFAYVIIFVPSYITVDHILRAKLTLAMAIFSFAASLLSLCDICPELRIAKLYRNLALQILVILLVCSILASVCCYNLASAKAMTMLNDFCPNALAWFSILNLYCYTCIRQYRTMKHSSSSSDSPMQRTKTEKDRRRS